MQRRQRGHEAGAEAAAREHRAPHHEAGRPSYDTPPTRLFWG